MVDENRFANTENIEAIVARPVKPDYLKFSAIFMEMPKKNVLTQNWKQEASSICKP